MWRRTLKRLKEVGYLNQVNEELYELTDEGFARADKEDSLAPLMLSLSLPGTPDKQVLSVESSKAIEVKQLDLLLSSQALISSIQVNGKSSFRSEIAMDHTKIVALYNAPRADKLSWDHSGPAALRLVFAISGRRNHVVLPIVIKPIMVGNTQWIKLDGEQVFTVK